MGEMMFGYGARWALWQVSLTWAGMIVFWGLLICAVYALIATATRKPGHGHAGPDARDTLNQRLARGEIDTEEYRRLRDLITTGDHDTPASAGSAR